MSKYPKLKAPAIVAEAAKSENTPWVHYGRDRITGMDCVGLILTTYRELGYEIIAPDQYGLGDEFDLLIGELEKHFDKVEDLSKLLPSDILVFRAHQMHNHVGIYDGNGRFIHGYSAVDTMRVVWQTLNGKWRTRMVGAYRYRNLVV